MTILSDTQANIDVQDHSKVTDIGDGLIMRWSTKADTDNVVQLVGDCFRWLPLGDPHPEDEIPGPHELLKAGARRLLTGKTAAMSEHDYALVEDTNNKAKGLNPIVACVAIHSVPAYYGSVNLVFGKPELIATEPSYRNKGLIRKLMHEMIHPASEAKGHVLQFIPGIPYFYRQFGYEYGLSPVPGSKIDSTEIPPLSPSNHGEPYPLRSATQTDIPFLTRLSQTPHQYLEPRAAAVGTRYTREYWQYAVHDSFLDQQSRFDADRQTFIVTHGDGKAVGFVSMSHVFFGSTVEAFALDEGEGVHYVDVVQSAMRQLFEFAKERQARNAEALEDFRNSSATATKAEPTSAIEEAAAAASAIVNSTPMPPPSVSLALCLHNNHPLIQLLGTKAKRLPAGVNLPGFRVYTRINSYPLFLTTVRPELELRLAQNPATAGTSCRLRLDFFRKVEGNSSKGLEIVIEKGQLVKIHDWAKPSPEELFSERQAWKKENQKNGAKAPTVYYANFAPLTFTQLVTGKQSLEELIWSYGENSARDDGARLVLNTLFPKVEHSMDFFDW
ncbi:hypothetical protein EC957_003860 [Mortierella hygrophila]|uniref:Uncharacterized protein n=1 Tax=Mortierella hygrophila TaxID=979708 RepID=A0A9P6K7F4_9FUNG|nr:hypothetical protein EC957_003860 [Mortierella hygrophila]